MARMGEENGRSGSVRLGLWSTLVVAVLANSYYQLFVLREKVVTGDWEQIVRLLDPSG